MLAWSPWIDWSELLRRRTAPWFTCKTGPLPELFRWGTLRCLSQWRIPATKWGRVSRVWEESSLTMYEPMWAWVLAYLSSYPSYHYLKEGPQPAAHSFSGDHGEPISPMIGDRGLSLSDSGQIRGVAAGVACHDRGMKSVDYNHWL